MESDTTAIISAVADSITALSALAAVVIACRGLNAWRDELRGTAEYDLVQRLLTTIYRVREGFRVVRDPTMLGNEWVDRPGRNASQQVRGRFDVCVQEEVEAAC